MTNAAATQKARDKTSCRLCRDPYAPYLYKRTRRYCKDHAPSLAVFKPVAVEQAPQPMPVFPKAPEWRPSPSSDDFNGAFARTYDPETSKIAAKCVAVADREKEVMSALMEGDATNEGLADWLNAKHGRAEIPSNVSPRIAPLRRKGMVEDAGYTKKSRQGMSNKVWRLTQIGRDYIESLEDQNLNIEPR